MNKKIFIGLSILVIILVIAFTIVMLTGKEDVTNNKVGNTNNESQTNETNKNEEISKKEEEKEWGVSDRFPARNDVTELFLINFPYYRGYTEGYGVIADQMDGTLVYVSGQGSRSPEISNQSEVFPAYFEHIQFLFEAYEGILTDNYHFTLKSTDKKMIGDYKMDIFECEMEFDEETKIMGKWQDVHHKYQFVAYATTLKSNGAHAFWVVFDTSEDQSKGNLIAEHALNMAKTFREE